MKGVQHMNVRLLPLAAVLCLVAAFGLFLASMASDPIERLGNPTVWSVGFCMLTWIFAMTSIAGFVQAIQAHRWDVHPGVRRHAFLVSTANVSVLVYLAYWGIIGLRHVGMTREHTRVRLYAFDEMDALTARRNDSAGDRSN